MDSSFYLALKKIGTAKEDPDTIEDDLDNGLVDLYEVLKNYKRDDQIKKNYIKAALDQIEEERIRIESLWFSNIEELPSLEQEIKDIKTGKVKPPDFTKDEIEQNEIQQTYHEAVFDQINAAQCKLIEWLIAIYPEEYYYDERMIKFVKTRISYYSVVKQAFLIDSARERIFKEHPSKLLINYRDELDKILGEENKFFKGFGMDETISHFLVFVSQLNNKTPREQFLNGNQFLSFLKKAFLRDPKEKKQTINIGPGEKGFVIKRFYEYYEKATRDKGCSNKKKPFIDLILDCFTNFKRSQVESYFKPSKVKRIWKT